MTEQTATWDTSSHVEQQVEALLQQLTLEEKIDLVSGKLVVGDDSTSAPVPQAGRLLFSLSDGPAGVRLANRSEGGSTALPAPIALAATWNPELARRYGDLLGEEAVATGHNVLLGPAVDIARAPVAGRTFESLGEDPLLQARMVVPEIKAIQARPVEACIKHYIVNNQESERNTIDVRVDERALQGIYLPPFTAAVHEARVASVMGAYNRINGTYACENIHTLTAVLREQLGFRGWVMSDYLANQSTVESANAGLDWELGAKKWGAQLLEAVQSGQVSVATIDAMVRRILRPTVGLGLLDHPVTSNPSPVRQHGEEARAIAEQGIVLLKNAGDLLPLSNHNFRSIAVIGPDADNVSAAGGGSALVQPTYAVSVLEGIRQRAGADIHVAYAPGTDPIGAGALLPGPTAVPSSVLMPPDATPGEHGLRAEYWANPGFMGESSLTRIEPRAELNYGFFDFPGLNAASPKLPPKPTDLNGPISVRWTGSLTAPANGDYMLSLTCLGTGRLYLDSQLLIDTADSAMKTDLNHKARPPDDAPLLDTAGNAVTVRTATTHLVAGEPHSVMIEYAADVPRAGIFNEAMLRFGWQPPTDAITPAIAEAATLARQFDVAIVVARTFESEGMDRPNLRLPNDQDRLIRAVATANPRTVVVLMSGGPVETASWEDGVPAIIEAWYAGQEQGNAIARVLFGDVNPSGKLPLTFPRSEGETPVSTPAQYPGIGGAVHYSEGIFVGYRGYDQFGIEPQYPFGHGLSYTTFGYNNLRLSAIQISPNDELKISVDVTNTGQRAGHEVAQLYVRDIAASMARPPKELKGFAKVELVPGEMRTVTLTLGKESLAYWDDGQHAWVAEAGAFEVLIGSSSRDIRARAEFQLTETVVFT